MALLASLGLAQVVGCSTATSLGLPFASGPHRLTQTAKQFRQQATQAVPFPRELEKSLMPEYRVEPGDVLLVEADNFDSNVRLPSDQPVQPDGSIELGKYGRLHVAGMTVAEIEDSVRRVVSDIEADPFADDPQQGDQERLDPTSINVRLVSRESKVYYVLGEVNAPGSYPVTGRETALDALLAAGGITNRGNEAAVILTRPTGPDDCRVVLPVCYREIVQLGDTSTNYQIQPGDRIYVPSMTLGQDLHALWHCCKEKPCPECGPAGQPCYAGHAPGEAAHCEACAQKSRSSWRNWFP